MEEPVGSSLRQSHHKRKIAVRHHTYEYGQLLWLLSTVVLDVKMISGKVYLHLLTRLIDITVRDIMLVAILSDILTELGVTIAIGTLLPVVVLIDKLHVSMLPGETLYDLGHHAS